LAQQRTNQSNGLSVHGVTKFSDLTVEEFKNLYLMPPTQKKSQQNANKVQYKKNPALPTTFDWRQKGAVTPVKDQGQCGRYLFIHFHSFEIFLHYLN